MKHFEKWKWALYIISLIIPLWKATAVRNGHTQWEPRWGKPFFSLLFPLTGLMSGEWPSVLTCKQMFKGVSTSIYGWLSEWKRSSCMCTYFHSAANGGSHANTQFYQSEKKNVFTYIYKRCIMKASLVGSNTHSVYLYYTLTYVTKSWDLTAWQ